MNATLKPILQTIFFALLVFNIISCGGAKTEENYNTSPLDSMVGETSEAAPNNVELESLNNSAEGVGRNPASIEEEIEEESASAESSTVENETASASESEHQLIPSPILLTQELTKGNIIYYCPTKVLEGSSCQVYVTLTRNELKKALTAFNQKINGINSNSDTLDTKHAQLELTDSMLVELKFDSDEFKTISEPIYTKQAFDTLNELNWEWFVKPKATGNHELTIVVYTYNVKANKRSNQILSKHFLIAVEVDARNYFSKLWEYLNDNPVWIFTQLFFPVIAFFAGKSRGKKS